MQDMVGRRHPAQRGLGEERPAVVAVAAIVFACERGRERDARCEVPARTRIKVVGVFVEPQVGVAVAHRLFRRKIKSYRNFMVSVINLCI